MKWAIIFISKIIGVSVFVCFVLSSGVYAWSAEETPSVGWKRGDVSFAGNCVGQYQDISVNGEGTVHACVMGSGTRVATFYMAQGGVGAAISFPHDNQYYRFDICGDIWGCIYNEQTDTILSYGWSSGAGYTAQVYRSITMRLLRYIDVDGSSIRYGLVNSQPDMILSHPDGTNLSAESLAVSQNGKWMVVEARTYGIFLIETATLKMRRVYAPGFRYGYGSDPDVRMAISNDGSTLALMGYRMGVGLVDVRKPCGEVPTANMQHNFTGAVTRCQHIPVDSDDFIPQLYVALHPYFNVDGDVLSFQAHSYQGFGRHVTLTSARSTSSDSVAYLALGDSFSSGEGELNDSWYEVTTNPSCHVSKRSYPYLVGASWGVSTRNIACSGATIAQVLAKSTEEGSQLDILKNGQPQMISVGLGGNDAGLMGKLKACVSVGTCEWAESAANRAQTAQEIKSLYATLRNFYGELRNYSDKPIIIMGYPQIVSTDPSCHSNIGLLLNQAERRFMNEAIHYLNNVIETAVTDAGMLFSNVQSAFTNNTLCSVSDNPAMNGIRFGDDFSPVAALPDMTVIGAESFHPRPYGHRLLADAIIAQYPNTASLNVCTEGCTVSNRSPEPSAYWEAPTEEPMKRTYLDFIPVVSQKLKNSLSLTFSRLSFKPGTAVRAELHSDPHTLAVLEADNDGGLAADIPLAGGSISPGFHSVHLIGTSYAGQLIEYYDFIEVEADILSSVSASSTPGDLNVPVIPAAVPKNNTPPRQHGDILTSSLETFSLGDTQFSSDKQVKGEAVTRREPAHNSSAIWPYIAMAAGGLILSGLALCGLYRQIVPRPSSR